MVTRGFGRCELVSGDVPCSRLSGAARLWGEVLGTGILGVCMECKLVCGRLRAVGWVLSGGVGKPCLTQF